MLFSDGSHHSIGLDHGEHLQQEIATNLMAFWKSAGSLGYDRNAVIRTAIWNEALLSPDILEEIGGIAKGSKKRFPELLAYNLYHGIVFPDECTVLFGLNSPKSPKERFEVE